jgi:tripartite-type tricarboxylate transporter receptor subunit TctC
VAAPRRLSTLTDIPTTAEAGLPGIELSNWFGIMAPRGTSAQLVARINSAFNTALALPAVRSALTRQGIEPVTETAEQFAARLQEDAKSYAKIVEQVGLTPQ